MDDKTEKDLKHALALIPEIYMERIKEQLSTTAARWGSSYSEEELAEMREKYERAREKQRKLAKAFRLIDDPIANLHAPMGEGTFSYNCEGCDPGAYAEDYPEWPCRTADILIEKYLGDSYV